MLLEVVIGGINFICNFDAKVPKFTKRVDNRLCKNVEVLINTWYVEKGHFQIGAKLAETLNLGSYG
jgi:hypothetical protein